MIKNLLNGNKIELSLGEAIALTIVLIIVVGAALYLADPSIINK